MRQCEYEEIEAYMLACMNDTVHDKLHVYRVVNYAVQIAEKTGGADFDIVLVAALLHDIGRVEEKQNPALCHAEVGAKKARGYLLSKGYQTDFSQQVSQCILSHRHKSGVIPQSLEAKIVFDADKLDLIGTVGVARVILFGGQIDEPLYQCDHNGLACLESSDKAPSLLREYHRKLCRLSDKLYTETAKEIATEQQAAMNLYFDTLMQEINRNHISGRNILSIHLEP